MFNPVQPTSKFHGLVCPVCFHQLWYQRYALNVNGCLILFICKLLFLNDLFQNMLGAVLYLFGFEHSNSPSLSAHQILVIFTKHRTVKLIPFFTTYNHNCIYFRWGFFASKSFDQRNEYRFQVYTLTFKLELPVIVCI